jgi:hypothetical protein
VRTYRNLAADPETSPYALNVIAPNLDAARELAPRIAALDGVAGVRWIEDFVGVSESKASQATVGEFRRRLLSLT